MFFNVRSGGFRVSLDQGWLLRADVQRAFRWPAWGLDGNWTTYADIGGVQVNRTPWTGSGGENVVSLAGIGGGLTMIRGQLVGRRHQRVSHW